MKTPSRKRAVVKASAKPGLAPNPAGRVDILLMRIGELMTRKLEKGLAGVGAAVSLWDGPDGVGSAVQQFCDEKGLTGLVASPVSLARRAGLLGGKRKKRVG